MRGFIVGSLLGWGVSSAKHVCVYPSEVVSVDNGLDVMEMYISFAVGVIWINW